MTHERKSEIAAALSALLVAALAVVCVLCAGCGSTGTFVSVGEESAPIDLSDSSESVKARALFTRTGAAVWARKNSLVTLTYVNVYTNSYLWGFVEKSGVQDFGAKVEPCEVGPTDTSGETPTTE